MSCWAALAYTQGSQSQLVLDLQNVTASRIQAKATTELILLLYNFSQSCFTTGNGHLRDN